MPGLKVTFHGAGPDHLVPDNPWPGIRLQPKPIGSTILGNEPVDLSQAEQETLVKSEYEIRQDQIDELMITSPALYEQMVLNGSLEDKETIPDGIDV